MKLKKFFLILGKKIMIFKLELSPQNFHYDVLYPLYSAETFRREQEKYNLSIIIEWTKNSWRLARCRFQLPEHNGMKFFLLLIFQFQAILELLITGFHEKANSEFTRLF